MTITLPPRPYQTILYTDTNPSVDPKVVKVYSAIKDKAQTLQLAEAFVARHKGHVTLWKALPPRVRTRYSRLLPIAQPYQEQAHYHHIFNSHVKLPNLIRFDMVCFKVTSVKEHCFKVFEFTLENHNDKTLIKAGHGNNPDLKFPTPEMENALAMHFDLPTLQAELEEKYKELDEATKVLLTNKKLHHFDLMLQWWTKAAWNQLGAPVAMPYWISSLGGWEIIHHYPKPESYSFPAVAHCLNLALQIENEIGIPLLNGSWKDIKAKLIVVDGKVLLEGRVPTFQFESFDRSKLFEEIKQADPLLFAKLQKPCSFKRKMLENEHKCDKGEVPRLRSLALLKVLLIGKEFGHYPVGDHLMLLSVFQMAGVISAEKARSLLIPFVSKALVPFVEACRQKWIQTKSPANVLALVSGWSFGYRGHS